MTIFLSIFAYSQGENSNLLTKIVKDMNAKMKHDMEKKDYIEPKMAIAELEGDFVLYGVGGSNAVGEECANYRLLDDDVEDINSIDLW